MGQRDTLETVRDSDTNVVVATEKKQTDNVRLRHIYTTNRHYSQLSGKMLIPNQEISVSIAKAHELLSLEKFVKACCGGTSRTIRYFEVI